MIFTPGQLAARSDFYFQLASLIAAGVPLIQALEMVRGNSRKARTHVSIIISRLQAGTTFGEALNATGTWLPVFDRAVVHAGELSGRLDSTLRMLGNYYQERSALLRRILSDMAYPFFILHMAVVIFPTSMLGRVFWSGGIEEFVIQKLSILLPLYAVIIGSIVALQGSRGETWRNLMERILNAIPLVGGARKSLALARFSSGLEALLSAGVPVIQAWEIASNASGSSGIKKAVTWAVPRLEAGMVPSEALRQLPIFPELFRNLYTSGEVSGQLDSTLNRLYKHYQEQATHRFQNIGQWAPKIVFLIVALAIGYQIISFYSNYFNQLGNIDI
jgi:type IV pilus assembly protein PilC